MRVVAIGDTHGQHRQLTLPEGDILIHVGDYVQGANNLAAARHVADFADWAMGHDFEAVICVAGNHDTILARTPELLTAKGIIYLLDSGCTIGGLRIWGSPWITHIYGAFNDDEEALGRAFGRIPDGTDILITHSPPANMFDQSSRGRHTGSYSLERHCQRVRPKLHVFGHCHHSGRQQGEDGGTIYANVANMRNGMLQDTVPTFDVEAT